MSRSQFRSGFIIDRQPDVAGVMNETAVSWHLEDGAPRTISRFADPIWIAPPVGALGLAPLAQRSIDFRKFPERFRLPAKQILYAMLRHPMRISKRLMFSTLIKRASALRSYYEYVDGRPPEEPLSIEQTLNFVRDRTRNVAHIETIVSLIAVINEVNSLRVRGHLDHEIPFPRSKRGAKHWAQSLWREVHGKDFDGKGYQPFADDDLTAILNIARVYIDDLSSQIIECLRKCRSIDSGMPQGKRSLVAHKTAILREQKSHILSVAWVMPCEPIHNWPPRNYKSLLFHLRMCSTSCAIRILFGVGGRRSELQSLPLDCISENDGTTYLTTIYRKGEDDLSGRLVTLPVDRDVAQAVTIQKALRTLLVDELSADNEVDFDADALFIHHRRKSIDRGLTSIVVLLTGKDMTAEETAALQRTIRQSAVAVNGMLRDFKKYLVPHITGELSPHRFRKSVGRLVLLAMDSAPLVLQHIFGHRAFKTSLNYMFSSPFVQDELLECYPQLIAESLSRIYKGRSDLAGGGAALMRDAIAASCVAGSSAGGVGGDEIAEIEFVSLGLEMMERGFLVLTLLGPGKYCLKPVAARGPCAKPGASLFANVGRCSPSCRHHILLGLHREDLEYTRNWLHQMLKTPDLSPPMRKWFSNYESDIALALAGRPI